jgi:hypothetical protein
VKIAKLAVINQPKGCLENVKAHYSTRPPAKPKSEPFTQQMSALRQHSTERAIVFRLPTGFTAPLP